MIPEEVLAVAEEGETSTGCYRDDLGQEVIRDTKVMSCRPDATWPMDREASTWLGAELLML